MRILFYSASQVAFRKIVVVEFSACGQENINLASKGGRAGAAFFSMFIIFLQVRRDP